jgi:hypothetical protein
VLVDLPHLRHQLRHFPRHVRVQVLGLPALLLRHSCGLRDEVEISSYCAACLAIVDGVSDVTKEHLHSDHATRRGPLLKPYLNGLTRRGVRATVWVIYDVSAAQAKTMEIVISELK